MSDNLIFIIAIAVFLVVFGIALMRVMKKAKRIDQTGIETDAVVSRIEKDFDTPDTSGSSYYTYVEFTDNEGVKRECVMSMNITVDYKIGDKVRIKYIPGEYDMVRPAGSQEVV